MLIAKTDSTSTENLALQKNIAKSFHAEHLARRNDWTNFALCYSGGVDYARASLIQHVREPEKIWLARLKRAFNIPLGSDCVDTRAAFLNRVPVSLTLPANVEKYVANIDRKGNAFQTVNSQVMTTSMIYGGAVIVVDTPAVDVVPRSKKDAMDIGLRPYWTILTPLDLQNWKLDEYGAFEWALIRQNPKAQELDYAMLEVREIETPAFILWTKEKWIKLDKDGKIVGEGENKTGVVPIIVVNYSNTADCLFGESLLSDIDPLNREVNRGWSRIGELCEGQMFSQFIASGIDPRTFIKPGSDGALPTERIVELGIEKVIMLEQGGDAKYISPDTAIVLGILQTIGDQVQAAYRIASLKRGFARDEKGLSASGVSKAFDFLDTNQSLGDQAQLLESAYQKAFWLTGKIAAPGSADPLESYSVKFPSDFGVEGPDEVLQQAQLCLLSGLFDVEPFKREMMTKAAKVLFRELPKKEMDALLLAIKQSTASFQAPAPSPEFGNEIDKLLGEGTPEEEVKEEEEK